MTEVKNDEIRRAVRERYVRVAENDGAGCRCSQTSPTSTIRAPERRNPLTCHTRTSEGRHYREDFALRDWRVEVILGGGCSGMVRRSRSSRIRCSCSGSV